MKMLLMLILCSCAYEQPRMIRTTTITTTRYPAPTLVEPATVPAPRYAPVEDIGYDFTDIDNEIEQEDKDIESLGPSTIDVNNDYLEGEVSLGETKVLHGRR